MSDVAAAIDIIWSGVQRKQHHPVGLAHKLDLRRAYEVQLGILARYEAAGERQAGWKVGLTSAAMRAQQKVHEPCFGFLLESGNRSSGCRLELDALIRPGFENELCLTIGDTLRGPGVSFEQAQAAVVTAAPALEIVEKRGDFAADLPLTMADNAQQKFFVTGVPMPCAGLDLSAAAVIVSIDGMRVEEASGAQVMGNPIASIVWLANKLAEFDLSLRAGMRVMSGSFTRQYAVDGPCAIRSEFSPFGPVSTQFF